MEKQIMRMARSQETLSQHDRDMAQIHKRLEEELRNISCQQSEPHPMQRCILLLMDVATAKDSLIELREKVQSFDQLQVEVKAMVGRISSEYQNCMNELRYRLSLTQDDLAQATSKLVDCRRTEELLEQKNNEIEMLKSRICTLQLQFIHQKEQHRSKEQSLSLAKAQSDKEVFDLNRKINEILEIVHQKNNRVDELQAELKEARVEAQLFEMRIESARADIPSRMSMPLMNTLPPKRPSIEHIDVLGVWECAATNNEPLAQKRAEMASPQPLQKQENTAKLQGIHSPTDKYTSVTNRSAIRKKQQLQLKQIDGQMMNRMQMFISEMTATHRAKMKQLQRASVTNTFRTTKPTTTKQQWFSQQQRRLQPTGSVSARQ